MPRPQDTVVGRTRVPSASGEKPKGRGITAPFEENEAERA